MRIPLFEMERWQSEWEHHVAYNLSESGVHPLSLEEILAEDLSALQGAKLGYIQTDGTPQLREAIRALYPGATQENVLVTNGTAEANFLLAWSLVEPGDRVLVMRPNYMQLEGLLRAFGAEVVNFSLEEQLGWGLDLNRLEELSKDRSARLIVVTNPNNPTGARLDPQARQALVEVAERTGAWLLVDEVYQGAELDGQTTPSLWGTSKRVLVTCGLSKAYGLPGLRVGWIVAPAEIVEQTWPYHDYTTICISALSDRIARVALAPKTRKRILERTRAILRDNYALLEGWMREQGGILSCIPPAAGAIAFARYELAINSTELVQRLREHHDVLLVPGDHFGFDRFLRFGFGEPQEVLLAALERVGDGLARAQGGI